jgi:hypothetical protein
MEDAAAVAASSSHAMPNRPQREHDQLTDQREPNATRDVCAPDSGSDTKPRCKEEAMPEVLADYFNILREWSLSSRSDSGLAPDATE